MNGRLPTREEAINFTVSKFFERYFNGLQFLIITKLYTEEEITKELNSLYEKQIKDFELNTRDMQTKDFGLYLDIKKVIQQVFEANLTGMISIYHEKEGE